MNLSLLTVFDMVGCAVFALSGVLAAGRKRLDWFGVIVVALITAIGGGTVRDLLLDRHPIFWLKEPVYLWVIVGVSLSALLVIHFLPDSWRRETSTWRSLHGALLIADALGLGYFCIQGALIAQHAHLSFLPIVLLAVLTGVGGGILRDVLTSEIPLILHKEIYATAAILGIVVFLFLQNIAVDTRLAMMIGALTIVVLRLIAVFWNINAPRINLPGTNLK